MDVRRFFTGACAVSILAAALLGPVTAVSAQTTGVQAVRQELEQLRKEFEAVQQQYGQRLSALEARLGATAPTPATATAPAAAPQSTAEVPAGAAGAGGPAGSLPIYGTASAASKVFNPDIAVIGHFLGAAGRNTVNPSPALEMPESEASFQAIVDPYARADFFMAFGEEGVDLEEGFLTFPAIPGGLLVKVGKMRAAFGKVNALHSHMVPWTDRPLVVNNLTGGEEGVSDAGFSASRLITNPWIFLEATGQVYRGDSGDVFHSSTRGDLSYVGRLRGYQDFTDDTNLDFGLSYARGHNASGVIGGVDSGRFTTDLWGVDATIRWRPLRRAIYHSFLGRSELLWSPARAAGRAPVGVRVLRLGRLSIRAALVRRRAVRPVRSRHRGRTARQRPVLAADLLAERVQPGQRTVSSDQVRARRHGERVVVSIPVFDRRAWRAPVLADERNHHGHQGIGNRGGGGSLSRRHHGERSEQIERGDLD